MIIIIVEELESKDPSGDRWVNQLIMDNGTGIDKTPVHYVWIQINKDLIVREFCNRFTIQLSSTKKKKKDPKNLHQSDGNPTTLRNKNNELRKTIEPNINNEIQNSNNKASNKDTEMILKLQEFQCSTLSSTNFI